MDENNHAVRAEQQNPFMPFPPTLCLNMHAQLNVPESRLEIHRKDSRHEAEPPLLKPLFSLMLQYYKTVFG